MLTHLNDDCLLHIFQLLSLKDQLYLAEICERFQYLIVDYIWSKKYSELHSQLHCLRPLTLQEYKKFFRLNQENIRKLKVQDANNFAYVYNSTRLNERPDYSFYFSLKMQNLKELYCPEARVHDGYIELLSRNCPQLEELHLGRSLITGKYLDDMKNLKVIEIGGLVLQQPFWRYNFEEILVN